MKPDMTAEMAKHHDKPIEAVAITKHIEKDCPNIVTFRPCPLKCSLVSNR